MPVALAYSGWQSIALNRSRDAQHQANLAQIEGYRKQLKAALTENAGRESAVVEALISANLSNRNFLLPLLETPWVAPVTLDRLAAHGGEPPAREDAWRLYRESFPYGLLMWGMTQRVEPQIVNRFVGRLGTAAMDHDSFGLLGCS